MRPARILLLVISAALALASEGSATPGPSAQTPGTVRLQWTVAWPQADGKRLYCKKLEARPGLIRSVRVLIGGRSVAGPPDLSIVACQQTRHPAAAEKAWLWDGRNVYLSLLLLAGTCNVAGAAAHVTVILRTVGT